MTYPDFLPPETNLAHQPIETTGAAVLPKIAIGYGDEDFGSTDAEEVDTSLVTAGDQEDSASAEPESGTDQPVSSGKALGGLAAAEAATLEVKDSAETPGTPESADRPFTRSEMITEFDRWQRGEPVESRATVIGRLPKLTKAEHNIFQGVKLSYRAIDLYALCAGSEEIQLTTGLTAEQIELIRAHYEAFIEASAQYAEHHDLGQVDPNSPILKVGVFKPGINTQPWHVDPSSRPVLRCVASEGDAGSTNFGMGVLSRGSMRSSDYPPANADIGPEGTIRQITHGTGVISGFPAGYGLHTTPALNRGFRLFMSADIVLPIPAKIELARYNRYM